MLDSQAKFVDPSRQIGAPDGDQPVGFPFRVHWSTLFVALESAKLTVPPVALSKLPLPEPPPFQKTGSGSSVQWEMVIPKMDRPSAKPTIATEPIPPALREPLPRPEPLPVPAAGAPTVLQIGTERHWVFRVKPGALSFAGKLVVGGALTAAVSIPLVLRGYLPHNPEPVETGTRSGGWMRETSTPAGAVQPRQLVLYRPSLGAKDCRLEFTWKVSDRALAWTFRAKDPDNYYAMAIHALPPGPSTALSVEHFAVYQGVEGPHSSKVLLLGETNTNMAVQVRMDVNGTTFKLYLEGNAADSWSDNRLAAGALGFLEQPDQPADVDRVRMSFSESASQAGGA